MAAEAKPGDDGGRREDGGTSPSSGASPAWVGMTSLGFEFVAAILIPGAAGWWLDGRFGWRPWLMLAGGVLGFIAGLRILLRSVTSSTTKKR